MNNQPVYDVSYFISFFEAIPEDKWCVDELFDGDTACALGHCEVGLFSCENWNERQTALINLFMPVSPTSGHAPSVAIVNDGKHPRYQQPTPRARILAALREIQSKQESAKPKVAVVVQPCVHMWLECGVCMICSATKPAPSKEVMPTAIDPLAPLFAEIAKLT